MLLREVGITQSHVHRLVTKQFFYGSQVNPAHDEMTGKGVAEVVESEVSDASLTTSLLEGLLDGSDRVPVLAWEHSGVLGTVPEFVECIGCGWVHVDNAAFAVLGVPHNNLMPPEVDVVPN